MRNQGISYREGLKACLELLAAERKFARQIYSGVRGCLAG